MEPPAGNAEATLALSGGIIRPVEPSAARALSGPASTREVLP
jgi:hypothetical protein